MKMTEGVIYYNRGFKCVVRLIVSLFSLRKHYKGPITIFMEGDGLAQLAEDMRKTFSADVIYDANPNTTTYVRAVEVCMKAPYDINAWIDADTLILGEISEVFEGAKDHDIAIAHFAGWDSFGNQISKRIKKYEGLVPQEYIEKALAYGPAINCGVYSFPKNSRMLPEWLSVAKKGEKTGMFIPDEVACQVLLPQYKTKILPLKYNVSVRHDPGTKDIRIIHYHGRKHCKEYPLCELWIKEFIETLKTDICHIRSWLEEKGYGGDRRLKSFMNGKYGRKRFVKEIKSIIETDVKNQVEQVSYLKYIGPALPASADRNAEIDPKEVTFVTAADEKYIKCLELTFPTWKEKKKVGTKYPLVVFINGMEPTDSRLDFLKGKGLNVTLIPWDMKNVETQRERMLSTFVLGTAKHITTPYWVKLDADSYATDSSPLIQNFMKEYAFVGHRWGYSWDKHILELDKWSSTHKSRKIRRAKPMYDPSCKSGRRYYHKGKRTISYIQFQSTEFTRLCSELAGGERLPVPSHDTYLYYVANQLNIPWKKVNFKNDRGFHQGRSPEQLKEKIGKI